MSEGKQLLVAPGPHLSSKHTINKVMFMVIIALLFPTVGAVYYFGVYVIFVALTGITTAILTEYLARKLRKKEFHMDGSAIVTGLLLALILPPRIPLWAVVIGAAFAIAVAKEAFGGLGHNIFNPALVGRAFLTTSFAGLMTRYVLPVTSLTGDTITSPTVLSESYEITVDKMTLYQDLFFGNVGGSIGETSALLILIGGLLLISLRIINWRIPLLYIGTVFVFTFALGEDPLFHILAGGLFLGAFFMATDYVTIPLTNKGKMVFALGCGFLTVSIRIFGGMPEGVAFSILLMNAFTPLIDRYTIIRPLGYVKPEKKKKKKEEKKSERTKSDKVEEKTTKKTVEKKPEEKKKSGKKTSAASKKFKEGGK